MMQRERDRLWNDIQRIYWLKAFPSNGGRRLACESHQCKYYDTCRKTKMADRKFD